MFNTNFVYAAIPLIFGVCSSISSGNFRYGAFPIQSCGEDPAYFGYCIDCEQEQDCLDGYDDGEPNLCTDSSQACRTSKYYAACTDVSAVPDCYCPPGETIHKPDPYDNKKYLVCTDGDRHEFTCPGEEVYNPYTLECYTPTTTTPSTTTPSGCTPGENEIISVNCTCFRYCFDTDTTFYDDCCDPGGIFNDLTDNCDFYDLFSCTGKDDNKYVDIHNCNAYYICVNQEIFSKSNCPEGENFDDVKKICSEGAPCNALVDCGVCPDSETFIYIDCYNYYDCIENKDSDDPPFVPNPETCPEGTCFSANTTYCDIVD